MTIKICKNIFIKTGDFLRIFSKTNPDLSFLNDAQKELYTQIKLQIDNLVHHNGWFTKENILFAFEQWANALEKESLDKWLENYEFHIPKKPKTIGIIMAGNIPLVGFHDFLSVLISGNSALVKLSSNDQKLVPLLAQFLINEDDYFASRIVFTDEKMENFDAIIATGSNNTARYFNHYFEKYPNIIRKNRNSVAVLTGQETPEELNALGEDIFRYFGLGCRSVSKLFVPKDYNFDAFFQAIFNWNSIMNHAKYANNYDYNKAVYLMSEFKLLDNGFLLLKENESFGSPIGSLFWERYTDEEELQKKLTTNAENIQCVVGNLAGGVSFGKSQQPALWDYADGIDTLDFLIHLSDD